MIIKGNGFEIRPLTACKLDAAVQVYRQAQDFLALSGEDRPHAGLVLEDMRQSRAHHGLYCGIFDAGDELAGILDFVPDNFNGQPGKAFIALLMIAEPQRHKGLGKKVLQRLEEALAAGGQVNQIGAKVLANNPALQFWLHCGFQQMDETTQKSEDGQEVYELIKQIQSQAV